MKRVLAACAIAATVAHAPSADASSCGGGSSGSSSSSGGGGGGGDGGGGSGGCSDSTDVHGYRHCTKFGAWSTTMQIPLLIFEWGMAVQTFDNPLQDGGGSVEHDGEAFTYRVSSGGAKEAPARAVAMVTNLRFGIGSRLGLYGAGELEIGGLVAEPSRAEMTSTGKFGAPKLEERGAVAMGALGVVGFQRGTKRLLLGAEVAGGVRAVSYNYHSQYLSCEQSTSIVVARAVLEARARASVFLSPMMSLGAQLGTSVIDDRDWNVGVFLGGYTRAFAASR